MESVATRLGGAAFTVKEGNITAANARGWSKLLLTGPRRKRPGVQRRHPPLFMASRLRRAKPSKCLSEGRATSPRVSCKSEQNREAETQYYTHIPVKGSQPPGCVLRECVLAVGPHDDGVVWSAAHVGLSRDQRA